MAVAMTPGADCTTFEMSRFAPGVISISSVPIRRIDTGDSVVAASGETATTTSDSATCIVSRAMFTTAVSDAVTRNDSVVTAWNPSAATYNVLYPTGTRRIRNSPLPFDVPARVSPASRTVMPAIGRSSPLPVTRPLTVPVFGIGFVWA